MKLFIKILGVTLIACCLFNGSVDAMKREIRGKKRKGATTEIPHQKIMRAQTKQFEELQEEQTSLIKAINDTFVKAASDGNDQVIVTWLNTPIFKKTISHQTINMALFAAVKGQRVSTIRLFSQLRNELECITFIVLSQYADEHNYPEVKQALLQI